MNLKLEKPNYNKNMPIFFSESYLKTESNEYGWITGYINNKQIVTILYFIHSKLIFRLLRFTNETYFFDKKFKKSYEEEFLNKLVKIVKKLNIDMIIQPTTNVVFDNFPTNSIYAPFGSYKIDLTQDEEQLWNNLHSKHRNVIRNAKKKGIQVFENEYDINEIYEIINTTFARSSISFISKDKFIKQINNLKSNVKVFVAKTQDGKIQGCAVIPYSNYSGYYSHGGSISHPLTGAMNYLQWKVIISLKKSNVNYYDFVGARISPIKGSKLEGIQKFKKRFGSTLYIGYMWKYPIKPLKSKLFEFIYRILKKSEGDIIDQEKHKLND
ncbi:MAG: peptidoglycan bridge formation glycyltransferase FemA/FemB family protein [Sulfurovaceae bacterium]|nr:peptidoglycan bridge formation glycyltransferase FemA/FemB family protein [Sulfurovaceae bacterium]